MKYGLELKPKGYILEEESYVLVEYDAYTINEEKPKRLYKDRKILRQEVHNILNSAEIPLSSEKILDRISDENKERRPLIRMLRKLCDDRLVIEESIEGLKKYSLVKWEFTHDSSLPPKT